MMIHTSGSKARTRCSLLRDQIWSQLSSSDQTEDGRSQYYKGDNADKDNDHGDSGDPCLLRGVFRPRTED